MKDKEPKWLYVFPVLIGIVAITALILLIAL